ncbi:hypothetical protein Spaf_0643 [Streptococcus parasanguinis FW213]|uniref:Uncharacterized protein n=1 Tax=Streptococcus parasanguinis FW213 TaxID=1114965 RepID=I1ZKS7_STRPA|nr:hypothetical protein Spaf_0643 [Streptococcus parasanguinis FW213]
MKRLKLFFPESLKEALPLFFLKKLENFPIFSIRLSRIVVE